MSAAAGEFRLNPWISLVGPSELPDPTISQKEKDSSPKYDNNRVRYYGSTVNNVYIDWFRLQYAVNAAFARGAWGVDEDRLTYLKDGKRETTRQELGIPIIAPMVLRYTGQAASLSISAKAEAVTQYAVTRREMERNRAIAMTIAAQQGQFVEQAVEANTGFNANELRNRLLADSSYQDKETHAANCIMTMQEENNDYESMRNGYAPLVACSGMFGTHCRRNGMELTWEYVHPFDVAWDTNTNRPDLAGEFIIHCPLMSVAEICRRWPMKKEEVQKMTTAGSSLAGNNSGVWPQGQPRVFTGYYKDPQWTTLGWILKEDRPVCVDFEATNPDTGERLYTEKDLIEPPKDGKFGKYTKAWTGKTHKSFIEVVRYCTFIPYEYSPAALVTQQKWNGIGNSDLILEHGVCPLQEADFNTPSKVKFPVKLNTTMLLDGFVVAPVTAAIAPQRVANLVVADLTWRMGKAGNISTVIDSRALANSKMTREEVDFAQKEGNTIELDGSVAGGLNNALTRSDASLPQSFYQMWNIPGMINDIAQQGTGIYDSTQGKATGAGQLVGTTELLLQQSQTMMQPFVNCIVGGFKQMHQFDVQAGKDFFCQYPWALADMVGEPGLEVVMDSRDMRLEQFRAVVKTSVNSVQLKAATDQMILQFMQLGLLDPATAAELGGQSYPEDVWNGAKTATRQMQEAQAQQAQEQAKQQQAMMLSQQAAELQKRQDETYAKGLDFMAKQAGLDQKLRQPASQRLAEANIPVPSEQAEMAAPVGM